MQKIKIVCEDKYEAQKLTSLVYLEDSSETFIKAIINIIDTEMIVALKDKSVHSIVLKDKDNVEALADFLQSVLEEEHRITATTASDADVVITKS